MFNFFKKKNHEDEVWYSFFESLYYYCSDIEGHLKVDCNQYEYYLEYCLLTFPYYYEVEEEMKRFKELPYKNMYEVLNIIYSKANIRTIDIEEAQENNSLYSFLYIRVPINTTESLYFKVFFVTEDSGKKTYRILYHQAAFDTLENLATKIQDMPINFSIPYSSKEPQHFLQAMVALAKYASIEIPKELEVRFPDITVVTPANVGDFERIIKLVNLHPYDGDIKKDAESFYAEYISEEPENIDEPNFFDETFEDRLFSKRFNLVSQANCWDTDWKFDPEEIEEFINDLLLNIDMPDNFKGTWKFDYPEETFSYDLFPYIQQSLERIGLNLMDIQTFSDFSVFFIIKSDDVSEVLELSEKLALGFEKAE